MKKILDIIRGPHALRKVTFYAAEDVVVAPLHVLVTASLNENNERFIDVVDAFGQRLVEAIQTKAYAAAFTDGCNRREAAQWLADIASVKYGCDARPLEKWI